MTTAQEVLARILARLERDEDGQDVMEYAILAAFISPLVIFTVIQIAPWLNNTFQNVFNSLPT